MNENIPPNWYQYEFPLPEVTNAPVPSRADYSSKNVAWLIEFFGGMIGKSRSEIALRYENNTPNDSTDDVIVYHPDDRNYKSEASVCNFEKSPEMIRYEKFAKKSKVLKKFQDNSPAGIEYFGQNC